MMKEKRMKITCFNRTAYQITKLQQVQSTVIRKIIVIKLTQLSPISKIICHSNQKSLCFDNSFDIFIISIIIFWGKDYLSSHSFSSLTKTQLKMKAIFII